MLEAENEKRFLLVSIIPQKLSEEEAFVNIHEVISLVESYDGEVIDIVLQKREAKDRGLYIGRGKVDEIAQIIQEKDIQVVVLNAVVKPSQIFELQTFWEGTKVGIQVWDKVDLILKIFSQHAQTAEARMQIELAAMHHMGPRIYGMGEEMSRQGGMVGTRGIGETNTERMKRHFRTQIKKVKDDLDKLTANRQLQLDQRKKTGLKTVSLVGYTNAGKSSLFNYITGKNRLVKDALFVTLDSATGKMKIGNFPFDVLVTDTIGFMRDLPPDLIEAFKSTLLESVQSDVLLHVIDVADEDMEQKIIEVEKILHALKLDDKEKIYVFNKIDKKSVDTEILRQKYQVYDPHFISTKTGKGTEELIVTISSLISDNSKD